ncbi:hypothetical protein D9M70_467050 [compost metagenome]
MDEFADLGQLGQLGGLLLEQIFHGFHVVVGGALDFLDALGMLQLEVFGQLVEQGVGFGGEGCDFRDTGMGGKALQPADLYLDAKTDQAVFAEDRAQSAGFAGVAAIYGGNRGERGKLHECVLGQSVNEKGRTSYMVFVPLAACAPGSTTHGASGVSRAGAGTAR